MAALSACHLAIVYVACVFFLATQLSEVSAGSNVNDSGERFAILFDAGSSSTRVHIYKYTLSSASCGSFPNVHVPSTKDVVRPGLSSLADNPEDVPTYMNSLLEFAKSQVPTELHAQTPLFLKATAGVRKLTYDAAERLLRHVRFTFQAGPFLFRDDWAQIMSGQEEGALGWLAANQLMQRFPKELLGLRLPVPETKDAELSFRRMVKTMGVLEMGGASTQITMQVEPHVKVPRSYAYSMELCGTRLELYTHSYLNYGLESAQDVFFASHKTETTPCLGPGTTRAVPSGKVITGTGEWSKCLPLVQSALINKTTCSHASCSFNNIYQPPINREFFAFENFFYIRDLIGLSETASIQQWSDAGKDICTKSAAELRVKFPDTYKYSDGKLQHVCFSVAYITSLLTHGWGFSPQTSMPFTNDIGGFPVDWSVGGIVAELAKYHAQPSTKDMPVLAWVSIAGLFVMLVLFFLLQRHRVFQSKVCVLPMTMENFKTYTEPAQRDLCGLTEVVSAGKLQKDH
eukprot:GILJ01005021.1.p1 GENE.GILJ01005021.1~~GILJ01005021.1.p1  ORF type:complete len:516 (-),score=52.44 GILJ01005021.1:58-1605(-)